LSISVNRIQFLFSHKGILAQSIWSSSTLSSTLQATHVPEFDQLNDNTKMEHPGKIILWKIVTAECSQSIVKEIGGVIKSLTQGSPDVQESTLREYFLPNASFSHPYCRVPSISKGQIPLAGGLESIQLILAIYRWYRTLSPHIDLKVDSAGQLSIVP
jgi:hypothetical protein